MAISVTQVIYAFSDFLFTATLTNSVELLCRQKDLFHTYGGNSAVLL